MMMFRKPLAGLVVALAAVFSYAALPSTAQAAPDPDISGLWETNYGEAFFGQLNDGTWVAALDGRLGIVQLQGSFTGPRRLHLTIDGVEHDGVATLWVLPGDQKMRGFIKLDDVVITFRWRLQKP